MGLVRNIWRWLADRRLGFVVFGCLALGLAGVIADWLSLAQLLEQKQPFLSGAVALLAKIGAPLLGGGVAGGFLKLLATEGYFLEAVRGVVFGPEGVTQMDEKRRIETWRRLTAFIYVPVGGDRPSNLAADERFLESFTAAVERTCRYGEQHFVRDVEREVKVRWEPKKGPNVIAVEVLTKFKVIPFEPEGEVVYTTRRKASAALDLADYGAVDRFWVNRPSRDANGAETAPNQPDERIPVGSDEEKLIYRLKGRDVHDLIKHSLLYIDLSQDPIFEVSSTVVMHRLSVSLVNEAAGLAVKFYEFGWQQQLDEQFGRSNNIAAGQGRTFKTEKVLLPNQGYAFLFTKTP